MSQVVESGLPWAKSYDPNVPLSQTYPEATLCHLLNDVVKDNRERTALIFFGKNITYGELANYISGMALSLKQLGIVRGDKVVLLLPNCPQFVISYFGVMLTGASVVPVNPLSTDTELSHIFQDSGVKLIIALDLLAGKVEGVRKKLHAKGSKIAEHAYYTSLKDFMPFPINLLYPLKQKISPEAKQALNGTKQYMSLLKSSSGPMHMPAVDVHKDIGVLIYTGGTTGKPKGVMLSHYALVVNAMQARAWVDMNQNDRQITVLPLFHGFGMSVCMNAILLAGGSTVLVPRFDPLEVLKNMDKFNPTLFAGVPTMFIALINHPELKNYNLSSLRACYVGAAALAPEVKRQFEELTGARLMEGYGLTEAVTAICANPFERTNKTGSIGMPFSDVIMGIRDVETGEQVLPENRIGEIVLKSPSVMLGYYNRPQETAEALRNGWLYTGDIGYMDEEGYFYIVDRKKDMIISGGFNVYPREVEDVLYSHPAIKEVSVIGVPDSYKGERVKAFVSLKDGCTADEKEVIAFCKQHMIHYKVPSQIEFCAELPKTAIGKVLKRALKEMEAKSSVKQVANQAEANPEKAAVRGDGSGTQGKVNPPM